MSRIVVGGAHTARWKLVGLALAGCLLAVPRVSMGDSPDLTTFSLETLMNLEVTSVSKKEEPVSQAAAAVYVLTGEDIRRSGATSIPEALRRVPGLNVARIDSTRWAISARGFNGTFANKLLVLIDGRSVYTPLFSGVFWEHQDTALEDIDRIEVIRGPGAALWGANAVNGVINIITKHSAETKGGLAAVSIGNEDKAITTLRYGADLSETATGRAFVKYHNRDESERFDGGPNFDAADMWRGGFRIDNREGRDSFVLSSEGFGGHQDIRLREPTLDAPFSQLVEKQGYTSGGHILGRWERDGSEGRRYRVQAYYDKVDREEAVLRQRYDTFDLDAQFSMPAGESHELMFGFDYRFVQDSLRTRRIVSFDPEDRTLQYISTFIQDDIRLSPTVRLILGSKFEHNEFTGVEIEPTARIAWNPSPHQTLWAAVSRATRTPSRADNDFTLVSGVEPEPVSGLPLQYALVGNRDLGSERLVASEVGYRWQMTANFSFDVALFYNHYDDLIFSVQRPVIPVAGDRTFLRLPLVQENSVQADSYGGELVVNYVPLRSWRLTFWYAFVDIATSAEGSERSISIENPEGQSSQNQLMLRSLVDLPYNLEFDTGYRFVDSVPSFGVRPYHEAFVRLGWRPSPSWEFSLQVQNALHADHAEYAVDFINAERAEVERSYLGKVIWRF